MTGCTGRTLGNLIIAQFLRFADKHNRVTRKVSRPIWVSENRGLFPIILNWTSAVANFIKHCGSVRQRLALSFASKRVPIWQETIEIW